MSEQITSKSEFVNQIKKLFEIALNISRFGVNKSKQKKNHNQIWSIIDINYSKTINHAK